jgi:hypothetical protein
MEILLLWWDDLDDAVATLRHVAPKLLGFLFACTMFVATALALVASPQVMLVTFASVLSVSLFWAIRRRVLQPDR